MGKCPCSSPPVPAVAMQAIDYPSPFSSVQLSLEKMRTLLNVISVVLGMVLTGVAVQLRQLWILYVGFSRSEQAYVTSPTCPRKWRGVAALTLRLPPCTVISSPRTTITPPPSPPSITYHHPHPHHHHHPHPRLAHRFSFIKQGAPVVA